MRKTTPNTLSKKLKTPVRLVINVATMSGLEPVIIENYEHRDKFYTAIECLISKFSNISSILFHKEYNTEYRTYEVSRIYVTVDTNFDPIMFTEKRYRHKIKTVNDITELSKKRYLIQGMEIHEFQHWLFNLHPTLSAPMKGLNGSIAAKADRF